MSAVNALLSNVSVWIRAVLATVALVTIALPFHRTACRNFFERRITPELLVSLAAVSAFVQAAMLWFRGSENPGFFPLIGALIALSVARKFFESVSVKFKIQTGCTLAQSNFVAAILLIATVASAAHFAQSDNPDKSFNVFVAVLFSATPAALFFAKDLIIKAAAAAAESRGILIDNCRILYPKTLLNEVTLEMPAPKLLLTELQMLGLKVNGDIETPVAQMTKKAALNLATGRIFESEEQRPSGETVLLTHGLRDVATAFIIIWETRARVRSLRILLTVIFLGSLIAAAGGLLTPLYGALIAAAAQIILAAAANSSFYRLRVVQPAFG